MLLLPGPACAAGSAAAPRDAQHRAAAAVTEDSPGPAEVDRPSYLDDPRLLSSQRHTKERKCKTT